jgi:hypothetical protein
MGTGHIFLHCDTSLYVGQVWKVRKFWINKLNTQNYKDMRLFDRQRARVIMSAVGTKNVEATEAINAWSDR